MTRISIDYCSYRVAFCSLSIAFMQSERLMFVFSLFPFLVRIYFGFGPVDITAPNLKIKTNNETSKLGYRSTNIYNII